MDDPVDLPDAMRLVPHPRGAWLLQARGRCFLVPPELGRSLARAAGGAAPATTAAPAISPVIPSPASPDDPHHARRILAAVEAAVSAAPRRRRRTAGPWLRVPLVPAALVQRVSARLAPLAAWPALAAQTGMGVAGYVLGTVVPLDATLPADGGAPLAVATLVFLMLALWHELGHAAALRREGYPPGRIGAGLLLIVPVLYCDVTPVAALPRSGRLRVDLAGVAFQLAAGGLVCLAARGLQLEALRWAAAAALAAVAWSLLPFLRTDGHWIVADLLDHHALDRPLSPERTAGARPPAALRRRAGALVAYRLLHLAVVGAVLGVLPLRIARHLPLDAIAGKLPGRPDVAVPVLRGVLLLAAALLVGRYLRRGTRLIRAALSDLRTALGR
ncbi:MAG: hypothetical protein R6X25_07290 [Candidatus Krumholzibacteriia bacterium]